MTQFGIFGKAGAGALLAAPCRLAADRSGASAVEYGLLAALVGAAIVAAVAGLGGDLGGLSTGISNDVSETNAGV